MALKRVFIANKTYCAAGLEFMKNRIEPTVIPYFDYDPEIMPAIKKTIPGHDALIWNTRHKLTGDILDLVGPQLKAVSTTASGTDHIDKAELKKRGILLGNTPKVLDNAVADIAVGLMIAAGRRFKEGVQELENGDWKYGVCWRLGQDIVGSTVGIVGFGGIGQAVVRRLKGFDIARFIYSGRTDKPEAKVLGVERVPQEQLLKESDYVCLCCPLSEETRNLINANTLKLMKNSAVLVNIARGEIIDQEALYVALKEEQIFAAGLDVVTPEPLPKDHPLVSLPNCYILPHIGSTTIKTRDDMAILAAKNIVLALNGEPMLFPIPC